MKTRPRIAGLAFTIVAALGLMTYIRLAPSDPADWHVTANLYGWDQGGPWDQVVTMRGGATLRLSPAIGAPADLLARLDAIATATPRTSRVAGSVAEGRITWETRSLIWGFPDYTTAGVRDDGLYLYARLRFGLEDFGVNAARLQSWLARLASPA
jgi:uncharacterized protein (DUF1499 family)